MKLKTILLESSLNESNDDFVTDHHSLRTVKPENILPTQKLAVNRNIQLIQEGLVELLKTTHLVKSQILDNMREYIASFDDKKFSRKIGTIKKFYSSGVFGSAFQLNDGKTFKLTFDFKEVPFLYMYSYKSHVPGFVVVDKIYEDDFGDSKCFYIVRDPVQKIIESDKVEEVISDYKKGKRNVSYTDPLKTEVSKSLQAMYTMDPNWRGTHFNNIAIQNGKVVLYDGFSKAATPQVSVEKF